MSRSMNEIEADVTDRLELQMGFDLLDVKAAQDGARGNWASPRDAPQPEPPWPDVNSVMIKFLIAKAVECLNAGMEPSAVITQCAVHAWFEGGVEGYDGGRRDARA